MLKPNKTNYRSDIDGLRAIAVLSVVLYHFGFSVLKGGFIGVDVFFVISGFLITGIISKEMESGSFSFVKFYERRVRRIFPALFAMLAAALLMAYFVFLPTDLVLVSKSLISTLLFSSNIFFWKNSNYFDNSSELNPLLHTWSLAVEEQFYFIFPIFLVIAFALSKKLIKPLLWGSACVSFAACVWFQSSHPAATFYIAPFRAWELALGALLALGAVPQFRYKYQAELAGWVGLSLLVASILLISSGDSFPGWQAFVPVFGTMLIIHSGDFGQTSVSRLLSLKPMVFIGLISYSLYLWHWPIIVFTSYLNALEPLGWLTVPMLIFAFIVAYGSYRWIEQPFRIKNSSLFDSKTKLYGAVSFSFALLFILSGTLIHNKGATDRFNSEVVRLDIERFEQNPFGMCSSVSFDISTRENICRLGGQNAVDTVVWGDSHALSWMPAINTVLSQNGHAGVAFWQNTCPPLRNSFINSNINCKFTNEQSTKYIEANENIKTVILVSRWHYHYGQARHMPIYDLNGNKSNDFFKSLSETVSWLSSKGIKVWIIGPLPYTSEHISEKVILTGLYGNKADIERIGSDAEYEAAAYARTVGFENGIGLGNSKVYSRPYDWLCSKKKRSCRTIANSQTLYRDDNHLSLYGASYLSRMLQRDVDRFRLFEPSQANHRDENFR